MVSRASLLSFLAGFCFATASFAGDWRAIGPAVTEATFLGASSGIVAHLKSGNTDLGLQRLVGSHFVPVPFNYPIDYSEVTQFIADPGDERTIYFGLKYVCPGSCLQKSIDGGATWSPTGQGIVCQVNDALVADPQRPGTLYAAANTVTPGGHLSCEGVFRYDRRRRHVGPD